MSPLALLTDLHSTGFSQSNELAANPRSKGVLPFVGAVKFNPDEQGQLLHVTKGVTTDAS